jgi:TGF-beta receptor type-1
MNNNGNIIRCYCNSCDSNDFCDTTTVCLTRHVKIKTKKLNVFDSKYEYYCGEMGEQSFRKDVLQFQDCYLPTNNTMNYIAVTNSAEQCCDNSDYCNKNLKPTEFIYENPNQHHPHNKNINHNNNNNNLYGLTTINVVLIPIALFLIIFLIIIAFGLYFLLKRNKKMKFPNTTESTSSKSEIYPFIDGPHTLMIKGEKEIGCMHIPKLLFKKHTKKPIYKESPIMEKAYIIGENVLKSGHFAPLSDHAPSGTTTVTTSVNSANTSSNCITISTTEEAHSGSNPEYNSSSSFIDSGSGFGSPVVINRTIARDINLIECIGKGRYGQVWKSKWLEELVAVKTFASNESKSWENEINIYLTQCLRDENILGFIAADNVDRGIYTELWIITEFHENGALYDYLNNKTVTPEQMIIMALSMTKGLAHLHRPIIGCKGKLPLAHCDLKTKNILVKKDLTCCIGDLGLALCGDVDGNVPSGIDIRTGTKRYMAPEILDRIIDAGSIGAYQKADMYSLSLVFWEILRRCEFNEINNTLVKFDYQIPYYEHVDMNPDEGQMRDIVCRKKLRPEMLDVWKNGELESVREFTGLIEELWHEHPDGRLKALSVKKTLDKLKNNFSAIYEQS